MVCTRQALQPTFRAEQTDHGTLLRKEDVPPHSLPVFCGPACMAPLHLTCLSAFWQQPQDDPVILLVWGAVSSLWGQAHTAHIKNGSHAPWIKELHVYSQHLAALC